MEFTFEVDPDLDLAVGTELSFRAGHEAYGADGAYGMGVEPDTSTEAKPGSEDKVRMLAARYAAGMPLWHNSDCYDHGPARVGVEGAGGYGDDDGF